MASVTNNGISGAIGNVIFYSMNGKNYARSKPAKRKKKRGTPENPLNTIFGLVSRHGTSMLKQMSQGFLFSFGRDTYNRTRGWMRDRYAAQKDAPEWNLQMHSALICQLNTETDVRDFCWEGITVTDKGGGEIQVSFPAISPATALRAPAGTKQVNVKLVASTSAFNNSNRPGELLSHAFKFNYNDAVVQQQEIMLKAPYTQAGDMIILVLAFEFETATGVVKEKKWLPAGIVAMGRLKA